MHKVTMSRQDVIFASISYLDPNIQYKLAAWA